MIKIILLSAVLVLIHDWYPRECCDEKHCHPVPCEEIHSDGDKWTWKGHEWLKSRAEISPDGKCHVCADGFGRDYCIFLGGTS